MARTIDPASNGALYSIGMTIVIGNVLSKAALEERNFLASRFKVGMADRYYSICHGHTMLHRDIMQCLIPGECR